MGGRGGKRGDRGAGRDKKGRVAPRGGRDGFDVDDSPADSRRRDRREQRRDGERRKTDQLGATPARTHSQWDDRNDRGMFAASAGSPGPTALLPRAMGPTCGGCRNWLAHEEPGGRGTCDHPGSGFSFPFGDTPGCPYFVGRRG